MQGPTPALAEPEDTPALRWALRKAALKRRFG
jgi:hypothetical protein